MKALYLVPPPRKPGRLAAYSFLEEEIRALAASGVEVFLISTDAREDQTFGNIHQRALPRGNSWRERRRTLSFVAAQARALPKANLLSFREYYHFARIERFAAELIEQEQIDIIHSHFGWPGGFGGLLARAATSRPLVASLRGNDLLLDRSINYGARRDRFYDRALHSLLGLADLTLYYSEFMRREALRHGARADTARVVRKGVDLDRFRVTKDKETLRAELGFKARPLILTVASLIPRKGINFILQALADLKNSYDFSFVVCGEGPALESLKEDSRRLGLEDRTYFVGNIERKSIANYFSACDIFVLASLVEAAGNVVLEAMASGCPVVCTDSGGPPEYVEDAVTGFVVPTADSSALAEKIELLLGDPDLRETLGRNARRHTTQHLNYSRMIQDVLAAYREAAP